MSAQPDEVPHGVVYSEHRCSSLRALGYPNVPSAATVRASIERGDALAVVSGRPMRSQVGPSAAERATYLALLAASADHPVADNPGSPDDQVGIVVADTDGQDADAVEHVRQSRLSRWQRLPQ